MNILYLGARCFTKELAALGHRVVSAGVDPGADIVLPESGYDFERIAARFAPSWFPDVCLFVEELSDRRFPRKLEARPCPLVYYSIDTHLNMLWLPHFAGACDGLIVGHLDELAELRQRSGRVHWLPWSIDPAEYACVEAEKEYDVAFVGVVDSHRLRRQALLDAIGKRHRLKVLSPSPEKPWYSPAEIRALFCRSRIVINESIGGELNFRVFEAMATGAMLLTERIGDGLPELFEDGKHLVTYTSEDLLEKVARYLASPGEREAIAAAGMREVERKHTRIVRAGEVAALLETFAGAGRRTPETTANDLGRCWFLWAVRGYVGPESLSEAARLYFLAGQDDGTSAEACQNLAELQGYLGRWDFALANYARAAGLGRMNFRLSAQRGCLLLDRGRVDEARQALGAICGLDLPAEIAEGLAGAVAGDLPSRELYYWLGMAAEAIGDRFRKGDVRAGAEARLLLAGPDFFSRGRALGGPWPPFDIAEGDLYFGHRLYQHAAESYLNALLQDDGDPELQYRAAMALFHAFNYAGALKLISAACGKSADERYFEALDRIRKAAIR